MMLQLVRQARLIDPSQQLDQVGDILVREGQIEAIADHLSPPEDCEVIEAQGLILGPGLVDLYSTSSEPGHESRETLSDLLTAARAGGFTRITLLPTTEPCLDHPGAIQQLMTRSLDRSPVQVKVWGAITQNTQGAQLSELYDLREAGIVGLSDGAPLQDWVLVERLLDYAQPLGLPVAVWPCMASLARDGVIREGVLALQYGLPSLSVAAETSAIAALLELIEQAQSPPPIHLMRISTARSVALIAEAKQRGLPITASTTWLHVLYNAEVLGCYDPMLQIAPPLGNPEDQAALLIGLESGVIDAIAIDHLAYTYEEKTVPFAQAPPGCPGYAIALPLLWQNLVVSGQWSALHLWEKLSLNPSRCLQQTSPAIALQSPAEMILFDPNYPADSGWSPQPLSGAVRYVWKNSFFQTLV